MDRPFHLSLKPLDGVLVSSHLQYTASIRWDEWRKALNGEERVVLHIVCTTPSMQHIKPLSHQVLEGLSKTFSNNTLQSLWTQSIWSSWAVPCDKQTVLHCLKLLFNRELIQTANSPRERKEIKVNPQNLYPGTDSFVFGSLAVGHAN